MAVSRLNLRSDLTTSVITLALFLAFITSGNGIANLDAPANLVLVVTDGVDPETGLCDDNRKSEKENQQDFYGLLKETISLLNDVNEGNMNESSGLLLVEMRCEDAADVIIEKIIDLITSHHVTGVLTITRGQVADHIVRVLQYQKVPVVELVSVDIIIREPISRNHFIVPHFVYWQMKHVILTANVFNWTALTISYQGQKSQSSGTIYAIKEVFTHLAFKHGVCVLPTHLRSDVPAVVFQLDDNVSSTLTHTDAEVALLVGQYPGTIFEEIMDSQGQLVLQLYARDTDGRNTIGQHLMETITTACNLSSVSSSLFSFPQYSYKNLCMNSSSLSLIRVDVKYYLESFLTSVSFLLSTSDVFMSSVSCNSSSTSLECLLLGSRETKLDEQSNLLILSRKFEVRYLSNNNKSQQCDSQHKEYDTLSVLGCAPSVVFNKDCGNLCDKCMTCFPSTITDTKVMTSGEGDAIIVAFFPIHMSAQGGFCNELNKDGYLASLTFLETVKSYSSGLNMSGIQGVVFDSCGSLDEVTSVLHSLHTCKFYFKEELSGRNISRVIAESSIIGYVNGFNNFTLPLSSNGKFNLYLQDYGYSTNLDFSQKYINNILVVLYKIQWTMINVLVSEQEPFLTFLKLLASSPLAGRFCFVNQVLIHTDPTLRDGDLDETLRSMNQTSAYLLLTTLEDSDLVFENIQKRAKNWTAKASFVLTQWNLDSGIDKVLPYVDVIIKLTPPVKNVSQAILNSLSRTLQWSQLVWGRDFSNVSMETFLNSSKLALTVEATEALLDSLEANYNAGTDLREVNLGLTRLRASALSAGRDFETEIAYMDTSLVISFFNGPSFNVCNSWCPVCHSGPPHKDPAQAKNLYLDGEILITGVFPLHQTGVSAFRCGSPQSDVRKLLQIQSFMLAIETFKIRYPYLLPGLRIGGVVLDSCSNSATALKVIGDFETGTLNFGGSDTKSSKDSAVNEKITETYKKTVNPVTNVAYLLDFNYSSLQSLHDSLETAQLPNVVFMNTVESMSQQQTNLEFIPATVQILVRLGWDKIIIISRKLSQVPQEINALISEAYSHNICVVATLDIESVLLPVSSDLKQYLGMPVVLLSSQEDSETLFNSLKSIKNSYFWIIPMYHKSWRPVLSKQDYFPLGSILVDRNSKVNEQFHIFLQNLTTQPGFVGSLSLWFQELWRLRFSCHFPTEELQELEKTQECPVTAPVSDMDITSPEVYDAILHVDAILHSLHVKYLDKCLHGYGICDQLAEEIQNRSLSLGPNVTFKYQGEQVQYTFNGQLLTELSVFNYRKDGVEQIGSYFKPSLTLNLTQIRLYTADGSELTTIPRAVCVSTCNCLTASAVNGTVFMETRQYIYVTVGEFINDLWAIIALAIAGFGALLSLIFALYVVYKVTKKALGKRFVSLGLTLLFSVALLYMSILPFVFTPSEAVCGLRYFLTGFSYTLCFAVILVKLMSLQSYKLIGLGGEVSKINQFLTTFFIVGIQIAIGVQWWLNNKPAMYSVHDSSGVRKYMCDFDRQGFVAYHSYVMLLILICCIYAISVRNEKKNLGEARLLLACSCSCVVIWATWLPSLVLLDRKWSDVIICAGILSCATAVLLIIFVPKIRMVSRLKYDLSQKTHVRNGHSLDTDFLYERPYSLPGTLTSTFSSAKMNYPKTASNFDADVNY